MFDSRPMTSEEAVALEALMAGEDAGYMMHFVGFSAPGQLQDQLAEARQDVFMSIFSNNILAGFYCLRGLDAGYARPSFGVYIQSRMKGLGLACASVRAAIAWCAAKSIPVLMLKVSWQNEGARRIYLESKFVEMAVCPDTLHVIMERVVD